MKSNPNVKKRELEVIGVENETIIHSLNQERMIKMYIKII